MARVNSYCARIVCPRVMLTGLPSRSFVTTLHSSLSGVSSREVDTVAQSMHHTEEAISELRLVDGLIDDLAEPPPILEADLERMVENGG